MSELQLLDNAARGMSAQRTILDVAARNVAAAQASTPGHAYARLVARAAALPDADPDAPFVPEDGDDDAGAAPVSITREAGTGDALTEMIAVLDAQRSYEANASIFAVGKRIAERTLDIER